MVALAGVSEMVSVVGPFAYRFSEEVPMSWSDGKKLHAEIVKSSVWNLDNFPDEYEVGGVQVKVKGSPGFLKGGMEWKVEWSARYFDEVVPFFGMSDVSKLPSTAVNWNNAYYRVWTGKCSYELRRPGEVIIEYDITGPGTTGHWKGEKKFNVKGKSIDARGNLGVHLLPEGSSVRIAPSMAELGKTPLNVSRSAGSHGIEVSYPGKATEMNYFMFSKNSYEVWAGTLKSLEPTTGMLEVTSTPPGSWIDVDGIKTEKYTPSTLKLEAGSHKIYVIQNKYDPQEKTVEVVAGETSSIDFTLELTPPPEKPPEMEEWKWQLKLYGTALGEVLQERWDYVFLEGGSLAGGLLGPEVDVAMDWIVENFGIDFNQDGRKEVVFFMGADLVQASKGAVSATAAANIASKAGEASGKNIAKQIIADPKKAGGLWTKLTPATQMAAARYVAKVPGGTTALNTMYQNLGKSIIPTAPQAVKWLLGAGTALLGGSVVLNWIASKELPEYSGLGVWAAIESSDVNAMDKALENFDDWLEWSDGGMAAIFREVPIIGDVFKANLKGLHDQRDIYELAIEDRKKQLTVWKIDTNVKTYGWVDGEPLTYYTRTHEKRGLTAGEHTARFESEGYEPAEITETMIVGETVGSSVVLNALPEPPEPPEPPVPPEEKLGSIEINANIKCTAYLDGNALQYHLATYVVTDVVPGSHTVKVSEPGYETPSTQTKTVDEGVTTIYNFTLQREVPEPPEEPEKATLTVQTTPSSLISIAGQITKEPSPWTGELDPGTYDIILEAEGYETEETTVYLSAGQVKTVSKVLTPSVPPTPPPEPPPTPPPEPPPTPPPTPPPEPPEPPAPTKWRVDFSTTPQGAKILINGQFTDRWTPGYVILLPGSYTFTLYKSGYKEYKDELLLEEL